MNGALWHGLFQLKLHSKVCLIAQLHNMDALCVQTSAAGVSANNARIDLAVCRSRSLPLSRLAGTAKCQRGTQSVGLAGFGSTTLLQASSTAHCIAPADTHDQNALLIAHTTWGLMPCSSQSCFTSTRTAAGC